LPRSSSTPDEETLGGLAHLRIGEDDLFLVELRIHPSPGYLEPQLNQRLAGFLDLLCGRHELLVVHPAFHQFSLPFIEQRPPRSLAPACWWRRREPCFRIAARLFHQSANGCSGDAVLSCDLSERHAGATVLNDLITVYVEPRTPDLTALQTGTAHACLDPFDNQAALKFTNGSDYDNQCATERTASVNLLMAGVMLERLPDNNLRHVRFVTLLGPDAPAESVVRRT